MIDTEDMDGWNDTLVQCRFFIMEVMENCPSGPNELMTLGVQGLINLSFVKKVDHHVDIMPSSDKNFENLFADSLDLHGVCNVSLRSYLTDDYIEVRGWRFGQGRYVPMRLADLETNMFIHPKVRFKDCW